MSHHRRSASSLGILGILDVSDERHIHIRSGRHSNRYRIIKPRVLRFRRSDTWLFLDTTAIRQHRMAAFRSPDNVFDSVHEESGHEALHAAWSAVLPDPDNALDIPDSPYVWQTRAHRTHQDWILHPLLPVGSGHCDGCLGADILQAWLSFSARGPNSDYPHQAALNAAIAVYLAVTAIAFFHSILELRHARDEHSERTAGAEDQPVFPDMAFLTPFIYGFVGIALPIPIAIVVRRWYGEWSLGFLF